MRGGICWNVQVMGSGPVLLLLHGTGASSDSFVELMPILARDFTVVAPDLPGHAFTTAPSWFEPSVAVIAAALDELLSGLQMAPDVAVGHSAGAALAARMTLDGSIAPRLLVGLGAALLPFRGVARAVFPPAARLLSVATRLLPLRVRDTESVERLLRKTGSSLGREGVERYRRLSERPRHVAGTLSMMANWDLEPLFTELPRLDTPFLLLAGEWDRAVPLAQQRVLAARLPRARLAVVERAGHLMHEEQPRAVARMILEEVHRTPPASGDE